MLTEKQFDVYLRNRKYEPPGADLAERIIGKAVAREYKPAFTEQFWEWVSERMALRPAYSVLAVLALGLVIGAALPVQTPHALYAVLDEDEML
ncbi:MAG TPA: hypothetical protein VFT64_03075 [Rickettsiales bacterium]|nr:hypothetical protein [Rickettsiales bacterium]